MIWSFVSTFSKLGILSLPFSIVAIIGKGKDKMPNFENVLTKDQIIAVVDYVKGLSKK